MHAILLFSAILHLAAIGLVAALTRRAWLNARGSAPSEPTVPETVATAAALGVLVLVVTTILVWMARSFGQAVTTGFMAGALTALSYLLALGALPHARPDTTPTYAARMTVMALIGLLLVTETVAFSFLVTSASSLARNA